MIFEPPESVFLVPYRIWRDTCEVFQVEELALMITATKDRSLDRSFDRLIDRSIDRFDQSFD